MKTRLIGIFVPLAVVTLCIAAGPPGKDRPAEIGKCIRFPGTHVPHPNLDNIIKILKKDQEYPQNYKVRVWDNGKMTFEIGQMKIEKAELSETDNYAKTSGLTSATIRVGICEMSFATDRQLKDANRLAKEISPILKKY